MINLYFILVHVHSSQSIHISNKLHFSIEKGGNWTVVNDRDQEISSRDGSEKFNLKNNDEQHPSKKIYLYIFFIVIELLIVILHLT